MRRRHPSALYSVLDEEQLLGGVELADHPDPGPGEGPAAHEQEYREPWSPSGTGQDAEWTPDDDDGLLDWPPDDEYANVEAVSTARVQRASPELSSSRVGASRRRVALGSLGALILVLLVARVLGSVLAGAGSRPLARPATAGSTVGALSAVSREPAGASAVRADPRRAHRPSSPRSTFRARVRDRHAAPASGSRHPSTDRQLPGSTARESRRSVQSTSRPSSHSQTANVGSPEPRGSSPEQEFGFER